MNNLRAVKAIETEPTTLKDRVNEYIGKQANLYFRTYKAVEAEAELENIELSTEDLRTITTGVFISTQRKFNL
jgi:hypothetical protein